MIPAVRLLRSPRYLGALAAGSVLAILLVATAAGQEPSPSATAGSEASPGSSASPGPTPEPTPYVTVGPIDIGSPSPGSGIQSLPIESLGVPPTTLLSPIPPTPIQHPTDGQSNTCFGCHSAINVKQHDIATQWQQSVHGKANIGCADCHGGDPTSKSVTQAMSTAANFIGVPDRKATVGICGGCHADPAIVGSYGLPTDMFAQYQTSVHGLRLYTENDTRVAICIDCHGVHDIKKASDPTAKVYPLNVPNLCGSCHSDEQRMAPYGIPTDQYEKYSHSVHGQALLVEQDTRAPTCASCHGSHGAKPPQSDEVVNVCGKCHTATQQLYLQSKHATLVDAAPKCMTCHGAHDPVLPDESRFFHLQPPEYECLTCHDPTDRTLKLKEARFTNDADRRCDTCHHADSLIYSQITAIHDSVTAASKAYDDAQARIDEAAGLGMIVTDADVTLTEAKTNLIQARAAVHTTNLTAVDELSQKAIAKADEARALAQAKIDETSFRRNAMVIVVGLIMLVVIGLYLYRRQLNADLHRDH